MTLNPAHPDPRDHYLSPSQALQLACELSMPFPAASRHLATVAYVGASMEGDRATTGSAAALLGAL